MLPVSNWSFGEKAKDFVENFASPTFAKMDKCIRFTMDVNYECPNPAVSSVRMPLVIGFWTILVLSFVIIIWGAFAPIDSAAVAHGTVTLLSNKKTIQHLEGGIIEELLVKDGDKVEAGAPLLRLNNISSTANLDMIKGQLYLARASEQRFIAIRDNLKEIEFGQDILDAAKKDEAIAKIVASQINMFNTQIAAQNSKIDSMQKRISQSKEQIKGLISQKSGTEESLILLTENINSIQKLLSKGYATKTHLRDLQRDAKLQEGNLGQYDAEISKVEQGITETEMTIAAQASEFESVIENGLRDSQAQVADLKDKLRVAQDVASRTLVSAPTSGIVNGLRYHTIGGIVQPGTPIMEIIPQDDQLIVEARLKPADINAVHVGLDAKIMFTSYKVRTTPKIPGKVILVSADKVTDTQSNPPDSYYIVRVEVDKKFLSKVTDEMQLYPGMPADIFVSTGSRSFLSYIFAPITDSMHRAFREE